MEIFKSELTKSIRVELHIANNTIEYEAFLQRLTVIIETPDTHNRRSPVVLAELIKTKNRFTRNIIELNAILEMSRARYCETQSSLRECNRLMEKMSQLKHVKCLKAAAHR